MASPPIPPQLDHLITRPFSFYPPIIGIEHNEWLYKKASWSEILVVNCKNAEEIWISRRYIGEVSRVDDPVLIVGLNRELEYKRGMVVPFERRVIEMPMAVGGNPATASRGERPAPGLIVGIRMASAQDKRMFKLIGAAVTVAILLYVLAVSLSRQRVVFTTKDQTYMGLTGRDDRTEVVVKLGEPATDRWSSEDAALQFEALDYPNRKLTVIMMGPDRNSVQYVGTMDKDWKPVHSVRLRLGGTTDSLLRGLKRF
jgi:hypothetical protein